MVWANPRIRCPLSDMRREWAFLTETARIAPPEFKAYWEERAQALAAGILSRETEEAAERSRAACEERARKATQSADRQKRLEKAFPGMREARLAAQRSRTTGRP